MIFVLATHRCISDRFILWQSDFTPTLLRAIFRYYFSFFSFLSLLHNCMRWSLQTISSSLSTLNGFEEDEAILLIDILRGFNIKPLPFGSFLGFSHYSSSVAGTSKFVSFLVLVQSLEKLP